MTIIEAVVHYDAIDAAWLTNVLTTAEVLVSGRVSAVARESCGHGLLSDSYRFHLSYEPPGAGPASIVGKFASEEATSREFGRQSGQYSKEIRFYQELAPELSAAIPTPLYAALADNETDFVLLMDDLAPARAVDQLVGCTADEAAMALEQCAMLHADSWHRADLEATNWLRRTMEGWLEITDGFEATVAEFPEAYGDLVPDADLTEAAKLVPRRDAWKRVLSERRCLWHNDLRADNLLFDAKAGTIPAAILDWQGVAYGCGTIDIAYLLGTSLTPDTRRENERSLLAHYHEALVARGVTGYSAGQCWEDYRLQAIHPLQTGLYGLGAVRRSERGDAMWCNWIDRSAAMTRDLDSFSLLAMR
jgi:aminoglycoside phosphotransferase (APT) family kinase protein